MSTMATPTGHIDNKGLTFNHITGGAEKEMAVERATISPLQSF